MNKSFWSTFQESDGTWSWGRVMGIFPVFTACFSVIWMVVRSQPHFDGIFIAAIAALAAFATCTFVTSKGIQAWKDKNQPPTQVSGVFQKTP